MSGNPSSPLERRLRWYWQLEVANAALLPGLAGLLVVQAGGVVSAGFYAAAAACAFLLVVGGLYWRLVLRQLEGARAAGAFWLPKLAAAQPFSLALLFAGLALVAFELTLALGRWTPATVAGAALATLAALEYVNYYHIQLQHFDNGADFKRLISGRGFRKAHMARDIAAWRSARGQK